MARKPPSEETEEKIDSSVFEIFWRIWTVRFFFWNVSVVIYAFPLPE